MDVVLDLDSGSGVFHFLFLFLFLLFVLLFVFVFLFFCFCFFPDFHEKTLEARTRSLIQYEVSNGSKLQNEGGKPTNFLRHIHGKHAHTLRAVNQKQRFACGP